MLEQLFKRPCSHRRRAGSQLHVIFEPFVRELCARGYARNTIHHYVEAVEHFGKWLERRRIGLREIQPIHVRNFLDHHLRRCRCPRPAVKTLTTCSAALSRLVPFLRRHRYLPEPWEKADPPTQADRLIVRFDQHLERVQGLADTTRRHRRAYAKAFLFWRFRQGQVRLRALNPKALFRYVNLRAQALKHSGIHDLTVGLRSFLRFLEFTGRVRSGLALAVPSPAPQHALPPPNILDEPSLRRFLRSFDRTHAMGRRDFAIALCFSELALRANEVAHLSLDDVDWRSLTLRLRQTKQRRERLLPLPPQVARAVADYLQHGRPPVSHRALFVRHRAPFGQALQAPDLRVIIRGAFRKCGLGCTGAYILRHSWATRAHRRGSDLKLIADILGHRSLNTTARYAQVHVEELRQAALPWPQARPSKRV